MIPLCDEIWIGLSRVRRKLNTNRVSGNPRVGILQKSIGSRSITAFSLPVCDSRALRASVPINVNSATHRPSFSPCAIYARRPDAPLSGFLGWVLASHGTGATRSPTLALMLKCLFWSLKANFWTTRTLLYRHHICISRRSIAWVFVKIEMRDSRGRNAQSLCT